MARTLYDKIWDEHVVHTRRRRHRRALHRPPSGARSHQPAGLRRHPPRRPHGLAPSRARPSPPRTTTSPTSRHATGLRRHRRPDLSQRAGRDHCGTATCKPSSASPPASDEHVQAPGHRAHHRTGARRYTLPGMTIVCGDSHTSTHGAFGALAFGIGTSGGRARPRHPDAAGQQAAKTMLAITVDGELAKPACTAKDIILAILGRIGTGGGIGHIASSTAARAIRALSMEGRMTVCNMSIEAGAQARASSPPTTGHVRLPRGSAARARPAPPGTKPSPTGRPSPLGRGTPPSTSRGRARRRRRSSRTCHLGHQRPSHGRWASTASRARIRPSFEKDARRSATRAERALDLHGAWNRRHSPSPRSPSTPSSSAPAPTARIEDLRAARGGRKEAGRQKCRREHQAGDPRGARLLDWSRSRPNAEGMRPGASWPPASTGESPGCSMCLAMNPDKLEPGERCASTSNRNFEGRQGAGGRTHLVSPAMAAAAAIHGHFIDIRTIA